MNYLERIQRAVDYIEDHLTDEITTDDVARRAAFSSWHFQRIFAATVGDTLGEYIRKRRLTLALQRLRESETRILDIAIDYQFESQESFTRAFKAAFGLTPGEARKDSTTCINALPKLRITFDYLEHLYGGMTMEPKFVTFAEKKVVGLGTNFISILSKDKNNYTVIPALWDRYLPLAKQIKHRVGRTDYGICEAIADKAKKSHPDELFYMACTEVTDFSEVPKDFMTKTIPAGRYAVFTHKGSLDRLQQTMSYIYGSWLPKAGVELRPAPDLEIYDQRFNPSLETSEMDICVPVK